MVLTKTKVLIESTGESGSSRKLSSTLIPGEKPVTVGEGGSIVLSGNSQLCASQDVDSANPNVHLGPKNLLLQ